MILILDNLRSAYNVGALFRTADGAAVERIYLVGITPRPPKPHQLALTLAEKMIQKTALGAEATVPFSGVKSLTRTVSQLRRRGYEIIALEAGESIASLDYRQWRPQSGKPPALIVGNEVSGLDARTLILADSILHLPMRGMKSSLNVSVAGSIALYHLSATMEKSQKNLRNIRE